jgi:hypothetical protein
MSSLTRMCSLLEYYYRVDGVDGELALKVGVDGVLSQLPLQVLRIPQTETDRQTDRQTHTHVSTWPSPHPARACTRTTKTSFFFAGAGAAAAAHTHIHHINTYSPLRAFLKRE